MKLELIEKAPIERVLEELSQLAQSQRFDAVKQAYAEAHAKLDSALNSASNPELADGVDTGTYAQLAQITPDAARKRMPKLIASGHAEKRGGRYVIFVDRLSA